MPTKMSSNRPECSQENIRIFIILPVLLCFFQLNWGYIPYNGQTSHHPLTGAGAQLGHQGHLTRAITLLMLGDDGPEKRTRRGTGAPTGRKPTQWGNRPPPVRNCQWGNGPPLVRNQRASNIRCELRLQQMQEQCHRQSRALAFTKQGQPGAMASANIAGQTYKQLKARVRTMNTHCIRHLHHDAWGND